jgi:hypothetical protein
MRSLKNHTTKGAVERGSDGFSSQEVRQDAVTRSSLGATPPPLGATLVRVAWLAILLGLAMEGLLLLLGTGFGDLLGLKPIVAGLVKNVSWSVFVCVGLALGTTLSKIRVPAMGLLGFLAAPLAFEVSRVLHKGTLEALAAPGGGGSDDLSPLLIAVIKGLEYGCLGIAVGWLGHRPWGGAVAHVAAGLVVGLVFGGLILLLLLGSSPQPPAADLVSRGMNEVLFPVGCSLALFSAGALGERVAARPESDPGKGA